MVPNLPDFHVILDVVSADNHPSAPPLKKKGIELKKNHQNKSVDRHPFHFDLSLSILPQPTESTVTVQDKLRYFGTNQLP